MLAVLQSAPLRSAAFAHRCSAARAVLPLARALSTSAVLAKGSATATSVPSTPAPRPRRMTVREARQIQQAAAAQPDNAKADANAAVEHIERSRQQAAGIPRRKHNPLAVWVATKLARVVGTTMPSTRASYATNKMYNACADIHEHQAWFWYGVCGLPRTFQTWWTITALHVWMVHVRLRGLPKEAGALLYSQALTNHFFLDAEERMQTEYHIKRERLVRKFMKDIHQQHRGLIFALDEALAQSPIKKAGLYGVVQGDAKFASALWRIVWGAGGFARGFDAVGGVRAKISDANDKPEAEIEEIEKAQREAELKLEEERAQALAEGKPDPFLPHMPEAANTTLYSGRVVPGQFAVPTEAASEAISQAVDFPELAFPQQLEMVTEYLHRELRRLTMRKDTEVYSGSLFAEGDPMNPRTHLQLRDEENSGIARQMYLRVLEGDDPLPAESRTRNPTDEGIIEGSIFGQI